MIPPALARLRIPTAAALMLILTACSASPEPPGESPSEGSANPSGATLNRAEFSHLHSLVFDEQDRALYAATHAGVWALPDPTAPAEADRATAQRLGSGTQDTMGMTLAPDGSLLASGHPGPGEATDLAAPNLGLIRSTDRAQTWEPVSLAGEVDFHALAATDNAGAERIVGLDSASSTLLTSNDAGRTWKHGATVAAHDLAFLPDDPNQIIATTPDGVQISQDFGQSFSVLANAPLLVFVEATTTGDIVGIDTSGLVWTATASATNWEAHGTADGEPLEAMTVAVGPDATSHLVVATDQRLMISTDLGITWISMAEIS
ncbi:hypothetical protein DNL40_12185 [Xylanimonas oleitrophica]|uniref:Exo-alpha-sialidase n=1 Tax=Xylanimonas oleitrophica TaxID=2607479 RepID=A0A2W5WNT7_9MICO|nr:hypothetical protein [Xylanimonas oleitrophica]PZR52423.1 hypothetical protein DNL40_12185 [Xylanimonas oleitrophica]